MSNLSKALGSSLLLASALAAPAIAGPHYSKFMPRYLAARLADVDRSPAFAKASARKESKKLAAVKPPALDPSYLIIDHPDAGQAAGQGTRVYAVNDGGLVSGQFRDSNSVMHAFLLAPDHQTFTTWQVGAYFTTGSWLNNKGDVAASYVDDDGVQHGYLRRFDGTITTFDVPGCIDGIEVFAINDKATHVGFCFDESFVVHGFMRDKDGTITLIDELNAGHDADQGTFPQGINRSGEVVGSYVDSGDVRHAFIRSPDGTFSEFDAADAGKGPGQGTDAWFVLNNGTIAAGYIDASDVGHGYIRSPEGTMTTVDVAGSPASEMQAVRGNSSVGDYLDADGVDHGFLRNKNGKITPFDAPGAGTSDGLGTTPWWMNRDKIVAGWFLDDNFVRHGFILNRH